LVLLVDPLCLPEALALLAVVALPAAAALVDPQSPCAATSSVLGGLRRYLLWRQWGRLLLLLLVLLSVYHLCQYFLLLDVGDFLRW
jgi:hypothetical protein